MWLLLQDDTFRITRLVIYYELNHIATVGIMENYSKKFIENRII